MTYYTVLNYLTTRNYYTQLKHISTIGKDWHGGIDIGRQKHFFMHNFAFARKDSHHMWRTDLLLPMNSLQGCNYIEVGLLE